MACPEMDLRHGLGDVVSGYVTEYNNDGACQYFFAAHPEAALQDRARRPSR